MNVLEISGWSSGVDRSGVNFLQPSDAFQNLENGFVYRQELKSRLGFREFATGSEVAGGLLQSRGRKPAETTITEEDVGNSVNNSEQTFSLLSLPVRRAYVVISVNDSVLGLKTITISYNSVDGSETFSGNYKTDGTNTIDWDTGAITVTFGLGNTTGTTLTGGDPILCTYLQEADVSVTALAQAEQTFTTEFQPISRTSIVVEAPTDAKTITITHAPSPIILEEDVGNSVNSNEQSFYVSYIPIAQTSMTISVDDSVHGFLSIVATYNGTWSFSGNVDAGTNTINEDTGAVTVTFDEILTGADEILVDYFNVDGASYTGEVDIDGVNTVNWNTGEITVTFDAALTAAPLLLTYQYYPSLRVMGIFEHILPDYNKELLIADKEYLYKYDETSNVFKQVPFTSSSPISSFSITSNDEYVSGTSYPTKSNEGRFVFTGKGMSDVYFYDGFGVKRFTNTVDNEDYDNPTQGTLNKAVHVLWFGERLNFFSATVGNIPYPQSVFYTGIRDSSGNGDDLQAVGAGLLQADTFEFMTSVQILGDIVIANFFRSAWSLEKTRDAFNPYYFRKIPSNLGADSSFGAVSYFNHVEALGKTGIISNDSREVTRIDNKIPYLTRDNITPEDIELVYAGFDRNNSQFLFSYRDNDANVDDTQNKVLVHNYEESSWSLYDQRFSCFGQTYSGQQLPWNSIDESHKDSWVSWDTTEDIWNKIGIGEEVQKTLAGDDYGFVYELTEDRDDYMYQILGISNASSAVVTIPNHAFEIGDRVLLQLVEGMEEVNDIEALVINLDRDIGTITLNLNTSGFGTYAWGGLISKVIDFKAETIPINPVRDQGRRCYISHVDFYLDTNEGSLRVDFLENEDETPYIRNVLVETTETFKRREYVRVTVNAEADFHTIVMRQLSGSEQVVVPMLKIFWKPGGEIYA